MFHPISDFPPPFQSVWALVEESDEFGLAPRGSPEGGLGDGEPGRPTGLVALRHFRACGVCRTLLHLQDVPWRQARLDILHNQFIHNLFL